MFEFFPKFYSYKRQKLRRFWTVTSTAKDINIQSSKRALAWKKIQENTLDIFMLDKVAKFY